MPGFKSKTIQEFTAEAVRCGLAVDLDAVSGVITIGAAVEPQSWFRDWLKEYRTEIAEMVREEFAACWTLH
jgi:hypothetical protein